MVTIRDEGKITPPLQEMSGLQHNINVMNDSSGFERKTSPTELSGLELREPNMNEVRPEIDFTPNGVARQVTSQSFLRGITNPAERFNTHLAGGEIMGNFGVPALI